MKCPSCGAEMNASNKYCEYCGSQITAEMQKEQEQLNKAGCPKCGSSNISFTRENLGEVRGKKSKQIIHRTVGVCKDCGATWYTDSEVKQRKTWLWVIGWIFIFPAPLTILLLRKEDMKKSLKYGIIAIAWIIYLAIGIGGNATDTNNSVSSAEPNAASSITETANTDSSSTADNISFELIAGESDKYSKTVTMNSGTEFAETLIVYYVPGGKYTVKNLGKYMTQVSVYEGVAKNLETGYDEYTDALTPLLLDPNAEGEIEIPEGWFIELHEPGHLLLTAK